MIKIKLEPFVIKLLYTVAASILFFQTMGIEWIISPLFYFSFILVFILFMIVLQREFILQDVLCISAIFVAIFCVITNALITDASVSFGYMKKVIMFSATMIYLQTASKMEISKEEKAFIKKIINVISIFLIFMYFSETEMMYFLNGRVTKYLTFRFTNPNLTCLFLICFAVFEIIEFLNNKEKKQKLFYGVVSGFLVFFIIETQARNGLIVIVLFFMILLLINRRHIVLRINKFVSAIISIWPLIFSFMYVYVLGNDKILKFFEFLVSRGKELDSRTVMWEYAFENISASPVIGAYNQISNGTGLSQMHNTHIDIIASYGIITFLIVCIWLSKLINKKDKVYNDRSRFLYMIGFSFTIVMGMAEAALFSGGLGIYIFSGMFVLMIGEGNNENNIYK